MPVVTIAASRVRAQGKQRVAVDLPWSAVLGIVRRAAQHPPTKAARIPAATKRFLREFIATHRKDLEYLARH